MICHYCHEVINGPPVALLDPWGKRYGYVHEHCDANYDGPSDEQQESFAERKADRKDSEQRTLEDAGR